MASKGHICLLALLLTSGIVKASQEAAENKLIPENEKDDDGRFFFSTGTSTGSNSDSTITLTLGVGDILLAVLALALSVAAGVVIAGLLLGNPLDGSSGYSGTSSYGTSGHSGESSYAVLRSLESAARKHE